ncbi:hypothetical protein GDO78_022165 [Eleutherodactylus coqui]|uniref:Protein lin-54 homolog n=1 Tax=Eleutherodactylus coqui TaxID=57060 RepID=A0A8J6JS58_ELECQ|nr:hypothetical protein GDO78_022165 [Eleutherodactylus coqui]
MSVVSAEVNSALPDEIMETGMSMVDDDSIEAITITSPMAEEVPMETELEEIVEVSSSGECITTSLVKEAAAPSNHDGHLAAVVSVASKPSPTPSATAMKTVLQSGIHKLATPLTGQVILNKASELTAGNRLIKQEKVYVTTLGKGSSPFVIIPQNAMSSAQKAGQNQNVDSKGTPQQIKLVTIGSQGGVSSVTSAHLINTATKSTLQGQQIQNVQIAKKVPISTSSGAVITKLIIAKPSNSKPISSGQLTQSASVFTSRVLPQGNSGGTTKAITITESGGVVGTSMESSVQTSNKIAISPLKSPPTKVTVVSVGSQPASSPQKTVGVPISVALGQQLLTVQSSSSSSPVKAITNSTTAQVGDSELHISTKPMVANATAVRMSVPIVPAQAVKQVAPKPINAPIVTTSQPQQRLLMPATPLAQIQPNLTNLPVLTPAPGTGSMGYAVLPAQYVTQFQQSSYVSIASNAGISGTQSSQNQPRVPLNGVMPSEATSRPRKPCNCTKSLCLKLYCDCFANGEFCNNCNCTNCYNNLEHENERQKAIKACLDRNPEAFKPKIGKGKEGESDRRHSKGCNCKRSGCLKNYCECYEEVAEATCACLLAQAEEGEKLSKSKAATERMILEEFGRCLMRVINSAGKAKSDPCPMSC